MDTTSGKIYYGLHFTHGVAEYRDQLNEKGEPLRIYIDAKVAQEMDKTFPGKPVYVNHVDGVDGKSFQEADGYVSESFFNKHDGFHWCKFIVTTKAGEEAIQNGWALSNAYFMDRSGHGGDCQGVEYDNEVLEATYEHLAIVQNPRYKQSVIMSPEDFKKYNIECEQQLFKLANSKKQEEKHNDTKKKKGVGMLNFFKRERVENSADLETTVVSLPRSNKEISIAELVKNADEMEMANEGDMYANGEHMVKCNGEEMTLNAMMEKYNEMYNSYEEMKKSNMEKEEKENMEDEKMKSMDNMDEDKKENMEEEDKKENEEEEAMENEEDPMYKNSSDYEALKNAEKKAVRVKNSPAPTYMLMKDKIEVGKKRYGSK